MKEREALKSMSLATNMRCKKCNAMLRHEIFVPHVVTQACNPNEKTKEAAQRADAVIRSVPKVQRIRCKCDCVELEVAPADEIDDPYVFAQMIDREGRRPKHWPELTSNSEGLNWADHKDEN